VGDQKDRRSNASFDNRRVHTFLGDVREKRFFNAPLGVQVSTGALGIAVRERGEKKKLSCASRGGQGKGKEKKPHGQNSAARKVMKTRRKSKYLRTGPNIFAERGKAPRESDIKTIGEEERNAGVQEKAQG